MLEVSGACKKLSLQGSQGLGIFTNEQRVSHIKHVLSLRKHKKPARQNLLLLHRTHPNDFPATGASPTNVVCSGTDQNDHQKPTG